MTPKQTHAYSKVRIALKNGILKRPKICSRCGKNPGLSSDGRTNIHAHHPDYDKPLDIEWLCVWCHRKETPFSPKHKNGGVVSPCLGEKNGQAKLTYKIVSMIRSSRESGSSIARRLGVDRTTVNRARKGTYWSAAASSGGKGER